MTANDENSNFPGLGFCAWCNFAAVVLNDYRLPMIDASTATAVTWGVNFDVALITGRLQGIDEGGNENGLFNIMKNAMDTK